jgi:6-pyruvoyltetrahydropterin/6-carboxytetrahydropterin synthase
MYEVGVVDAFEAAHRLKGEFGPATRQHGHTYRVELTVRGPSLSADGTLCDVGKLRAVLRREVEALHFQDLNQLAQFAQKNSTAEEVAGYLLERLKQPLADPRLESVAVRVWESPEVFAGIEARFG